MRPTPKEFRGAHGRRHAVRQFEQEQVKCDSCSDGVREEGSLWCRMCKIYWEPEKCATGCGGDAVWSSAWTHGRAICRECFDGWYECGIVKPEQLKLRTTMYRAGATDAAVEAAMRETFGERG